MANSLFFLCPRTIIPVLAIMISISVTNAQINASLTPNCSPCTTGTPPPCDACSSPPGLTFDINGYGGANNLTSDHPFQITFSATGPHTWTISSSFGLIFPTFFQHSGSSVTDGYSFGPLSSFFISAEPNNTHSGNYSFIINNGVDYLTVNIQIHGGSPGGAGLSISSIPAWAPHAGATAVPFPTYTFSASGGSGTYNWEILDGSNNPLNTTTTLGFGIVNGASTVTTLANQNSPITIGGQTPSGISTFNAKVRVTDANNSTLQDETTAVAFNVTTSALPPRGNTLLVKVCPSNVFPCSASDASVFSDPDPKLTRAKQWLDEVSYHPPSTPGLLEPGLLTFFEFPAYPSGNAFPLSFILPNYTNDNNPIGAISSEVLNQILSLSPGYIEGPDTKIDHIIFYVHDPSIPNILNFWASPGKINVATIEGIKTLGVSIVNANSDWRTIAHSLGLNLGMKHLHYYQNASFLGGGTLPSPNLTPVRWDHMAIAPDESLSGVHPVGYSKYLAQWLNTPASTGGVQYVQGGNNSFPSTTFNLSYQSQHSTGQTSVVVVDLTPGNNTLTGGRHYFWIEARSQNLSNEDSNVPGEGVLIYYVNTLVPAGAGPVLLYDYNSSTPTLNDAAVPAGQTASNINSSGLTVAVGSFSGGAYPVTLTYNPPPTNYDVYIPTGNPGWTSPDIWIWNQNDGGSRDDNRNTPEAGEQNRIYARVYNSGPATAYNIKVEFYFSAPYNGVESFVLYDSRLINEIPPNDHHDVFVTWTPPVGIDPHNCVRVLLKEAYNDSNLANNEAQQNLTVVDSRPGSPYPPQAYTFKIKNPDNISRYIYPEAKGIRKDWSYSFNPTGATFGPNEEKQFVFTFQPPDGFSTCTNHPINIIAWTPHEHTLVQLGGITVNAQLRNNTTLTLDQQLVACRDFPKDSDYEYSKISPKKGMVFSRQLTPSRYDNKSYGNLLSYIDAVLLNQGKRGFNRECKTIESRGCTNPVRANEKIVLRYRDSAGNPVYKEVMTDANGCYQDFFVVVEGGNWETTAIYPGDDCNGRSETSNTTNIDIPSNGDQDGDGLPDRDEIQGDDDGDGIPNHLDPDSDNDGILDGHEPRGNYDCDSYDNVIDDDSDNDGIPDAQDQTPYGHIPPFRAYVNGMYHRFEFDSKLPIRSGNGGGMHLGVFLHPKWSIEGGLGLTKTTDQDDVSGTVYNMNLNGLYHFDTKPAASFSPYLTAGLGGLMIKEFSSSANTFAVNAGVGIFAYQPYLKSNLTLRAEARAIYGLSGYDTDGHLNILYSIGIGYRFRTKTTPCDIERTLKRAYR